MSWSKAGVTITWRRGPAFLPGPHADRWEVRIARGGWTPAAVTDAPGGVLSTWPRACLQRPGHASQFAA